MHPLRWAVVVGAALPLMGASCATQASTTLAVTGKTLRVYSSVPNTPVGNDVFDAEKLALDKAGPQIGSFTVELRRLYESSTKDITNNARAAIKDNNTIAYLGEVAAGTSEDGSVEITNQIGLLQVSPTDNALELTQSTPAVPGAPNTFYPSKKSFSYTFARVVPSTAVEAQVQVAEMHKLKVNQLWIENDGSPYGRAIARAVQDDATGKVTLAQSATAADAVFLGARDPVKAAVMLNGLSGKQLFVPSALYDPTFASKFSTIHISVPGKVVPSLKLGPNPAPQAVFGYIAMKALLTDLHNQGGNANKLASVVDGFRSLSGQSSPLGTYSINQNGDTSLGPAAFAIEHLRGTKLVAIQAG